MYHGVGNYYYEAGQFEKLEETQSFCRRKTSKAGKDR